MQYVPDASVERGNREEDERKTSARIAIVTFSYHIGLFTGRVSYGAASYGNADIEPSNATLSEPRRSFSVGGDCFERYVMFTSKNPV
jgi:hypothetical protein